MLIYNDKQWQGFCRLIGRPELAADPRYATAASRSQQYSEINGLLASEFAQRDTQDWIAAFEAADIPVQKMNDLQDILDDPHLNAIDYFQEHPHPTEGTIRTTAPPVEWSGTPGGYRRHAPRLGEHTLEVLREAGIGQGDIDALLASGAARCAVSG